MAEAQAQGRVQGKVALITGAARGQGRSHALRLAEQGADIIAIDACTDIATVPYKLAKPEELQETKRLVEKLGRRAVAIQADVRDRGPLIQAVDEGVRELGKLDVVVANAGILNSDGEGKPGQAWVDVVDVNLVGVINTVHAAFKHLESGASVIVTGSAAAFMELPVGEDSGGGGYSFAKLTVAHYMHDLAASIGNQGIRVNAIHPTNCDTALLHNDVIYKAFRPDLENPTREDAELSFPAQQVMPIGYVQPEDISNAVVFLASEESRYVTGIQLRVDGGAYLKMRRFHP